MTTSRVFFTSGEKACLLELISRYPAITSYATEHAQLDAKKIAWAQLLLDFNSTEGNHTRTISQLQKCWDNAKTKRKRSLALAKSKVMKTGGGPMPPAPKDDHIDAMLNMSVDIEIRGVNDSDGLELASNQPSTSAGVCNEDNIFPMMPDVPTREYNSSMIHDAENSPIMPVEPSVEFDLNSRRLRNPRLQSIEEEAHIRMDRNNRLLHYDHELHLVKMEIVKLQLDTARLQTKVAAGELEIMEINKKHALLKYQNEKCKNGGNK